MTCKFKRAGRTERLDLLDVLILLLRIVLVAVLYLFLIMVMRFATRELRTVPGPAVRAPGRQPADGAGLSLIFVEAGGSRFSPGQVVEIGDGAVLGRGDRADVVLGDPTISSTHARLRRVGRTWLIADLGSTNGTRLNNVAVDDEVALAPGDVLTLGNVQLRVGAP
jgi:hypothetical protein